MFSLTDIQLYLCYLYVNDDLYEYGLGIGLRSAIMAKDPTEIIPARGSIPGPYQ